MSWYNNLAIAFYQALHDIIINNWSKASNILLLGDNRNKFLFVCVCDCNSKTMIQQKISIKSKTCIDSLW